MHSSAAFDASPNCKQSPDGRFIANFRASTVTVRSAETLQVVRAIKLGPGHNSVSASSALGSPIVSTLLWGPSSNSLLAATVAALEIFSVDDTSKHACIENYTTTSGKPSLIQFGARDSEVLVWSTSGLKLAIFDLQKSDVTEIANPKFHQPTTASRGLSFRPSTGHLALLTRVGGKDLISLHHPVDRKLLRSWAPDTVDAQGLVWSPDGNWLVLSESAVHGHKLIIYAPNGEFFRTLESTSLSKDPEAHLDLGVKTCQFSPDSELCAVGDHSRYVLLIRTASWRTSARLLHPATISPNDSLHVWREQIEALDGRSTYVFIPLSSKLSPPGPAPESKLLAADFRFGCSMAEFDASSTLLATRLDDSPWNLWIWNVASSEPQLRTVLIFHTSVSFQWHPRASGRLLVTRQDATQSGVAVIWQSSSNEPISVQPTDHLPNRTAVGRTQMSWISRETESPELLVSDTQHFLILSPLRGSEGSNPVDVRRADRVE